jgi:hypothetical protein
MKQRATAPAPKKNPAKREGKGGVIQRTLAGFEPASHCSPKPLCKKWRVLQAFMKGERWHRFTAFELHDTCLHSTVSTLRHSHGVKFLDRSIPIVTRHGFRTHVTQYWLDPDKVNMALAEALLAGA